MENENEYEYINDSGSDSDSDSEMKGGVGQEKKVPIPSKIVCQNLIKYHNEMKHYKTETKIIGDKEVKIYQYSNEPRVEGGNYIINDDIKNIQDNTKPNIDVYNVCTTYENNPFGNDISENKISDNIIGYMNKYAAILSENKIASSLDNMYKSILLLQLLNKTIVDYKKIWENKESINGVVKDKLEKMQLINIPEKLYEIFRFNDDKNYKSSDKNEYKGYTIPTTNTLNEYVDNYIKREQPNNPKSNIPSSEISTLRSKLIIEYHKKLGTETKELENKFINLYPEHYNQFIILKEEINQSLPILLIGQFHKKNADVMYFKYTERMKYDPSINGDKLNTTDYVFDTEHTFCIIEIDVNNNSLNPGIYNYSKKEDDAQTISTPAPDTNITASMDSMNKPGTGTPMSAVKTNKPIIRPGSAVKTNKSDTGSPVSVVNTNIPTNQPLPVDKTTNNTNKTGNSKPPIQTNNRPTTAISQNKPPIVSTGLSNNIPMDKPRQEYKPKDDASKTILRSMSANPGTRPKEQNNTLYRLSSDNN